ncbi:MAG: 4-hydroxy-tetrahydrodipicolinate reductase [Bacteroidales bacterium]
MIKIGLIGYGQMGRVLEATARERGHEIVFIIDAENRDQMTPDLLRQATVVLEFTHPDAAFPNIRACLEAGVPVVSGTTGWLHRMDEARELCEQNQCGLFYASNFSLGVNLFMELNEGLARLMDRYPQYRVRLEEVHHTRKADAPSGTALALANQLIGGIERLEGWSDDLIPDPSLVQVTSIREGQVTGIHEIHFISGEDKITIRHEAFNRQGFATGAILAAEFLPGRRGVFSMKDLLSI